MFGIGGFELFIILIFGFLIFGPDKLPEIAKTVGKGIARFREAQAEMSETLGGEKIFDPNNPDEPFKDPVEVLDRLAQKQEEKKAGKAPSGAKAGTGPSAGSPAGSAQPASATATPGAAKQESFTERKARYERERAARKAAEAEAAATAASSGSSSAKEPGSGNRPAGERSCEPEADRPEPAAEGPAGPAAREAAATAEGGDA